jgi:hypothetical protein
MADPKDNKDAAAKPAAQPDPAPAPAEATRPRADEGFHPLQVTTGPGRHGGVGQPLSEENADEVRRGIQGEDLPSPSAGDVHTAEGNVLRPADPANPPPSHVLPVVSDEAWSQDATGTVVHPDVDEENPSREVQRVTDVEGAENHPPLVGVTEQRAVFPNRTVESPDPVAVEVADPFELVRQAHARNATTLPVGTRGFVVDMEPPGRPESVLNPDGTLPEDDQTK